MRDAYKLTLDINLYVGLLIYGIVDLINY